jgi:formylglycine-generating enzyme required for sulfatase activity
MLASAGAPHEHAAMKKTMTLMAVLALAACDDAANQGPGGQLGRDSGALDFSFTDTGPRPDAEADAADDAADLGQADAAPPDQALPDAEPMGECAPGETSAEGCPQLGVCAGQVRATCGADGTFGPCEAPADLSQPETCDNLDNDCDGNLDEDFADLRRPCDDADDDLCALGLWQCDPAGTGLVCVGDQPQTELCNGRDDDCDGTTDEDTPAGEPASIQRGVCAGAALVCDGDGNYVEPDYTLIEGFEALEETCDGIDNDCDGVPDNGLFAPRAELQDGLCRNLRQTCAGAEGYMEPDYLALPGFEAAEVSCDGVDNDCDGQTDEDVIPPPCPEAVGVCNAPVAPGQCLGAAGFGDCDYGPEFELVENNTCDALDNDCDGRVDEGLACTPALRSVRVQLSAFTMGSPAEEVGRGADEDQVAVTFGDRAVLARVTEMTQLEYTDLMGANPSASVGGDRPVERVSWLSAAEALNQLSLAEGLAPCYVIDGDSVTWPEGLSCEGWRLPTEAEWEFLARSGSQNANYAADFGATLAQIAWYRDSSTLRTHPVARLTANAFSLHDILGNVSEWVWDRYGPFVGPEIHDPSGPELGDQRVVRGSGYGSPPEQIRAARRLRYLPSAAQVDVGLRPVRSLRSGL